MATFKFKCEARTFMSCKMGVFPQLKAGLSITDFLIDTDDGLDVTADTLHNDYENQTVQLINKPEIQGQYHFEKQKLMVYLLSLCSKGIQKELKAGGTQLRYNQIDRKMDHEKYWRGYYSGSRLLPPQMGQQQDEEKYEDYMEVIQINSCFSPTNYNQNKLGSDHFLTTGSYQNSNISFDAEINIRKNIDDEFNIWFKLNKGEAKFMKGKLEDNSITGVWARSEEDIATKDNYGQGKFVLEYVEPQKGWNGLFIQNGIEYNMTFDDLVIGHFSKEKVGEKGSSVVISGKGWDRKGKHFKIEGTYDPKSSIVEFVKSYQGHSVHYKGELKDIEVVGKYNEKQYFRLYYI